MTRRRVPVPAAGFRHVAVIRLSSLGDVVLTLPTVHALRRAYPEARLTYWVKEEFADVVRHDPAVTAVRVLERDARRLEDLVSMSAELEDCDLIVDLHGNARSRLLTFRQTAAVLRSPSHRLWRERWVRARWTGPRPLPHALVRYATALGPIGVEVPGVPRLAVGEAAERWAAEWWSAWSPPRPVVALCPGAKHFTKRWPEEHWVALVEALLGRDTPLLVLSLAAEREATPRLAARIAAAATARWCSEPLPRMAALLSRSAVAVSHDSGLMHVAAARGVPVVAMFGSTVPELGFGPSGEGHTVLCRHEPCQPCTLHGRPECPRRHFRCMRELLPPTVEAALASTLAVRP